MAKGTTSGFFGKRRPPAVLKHEVLRQYVAPFARMVGSTSREHRVVFLDGYAGEGRYDDGSPGSPMLAMETALGLLPNLIIDCVFVEKSRTSYDSLSAVASEYRTKGVRCEAVLGRVQDHLDAIIERASGVPLFLFLDPCGLAPPYEQLTTLMTGPRASQYPATEVLLNFSDKAVRHIGGQLKPGSKSSTGVKALDVACGGDWWQALYLDAAKAGHAETGVQAVVAEFATRFARDTNTEVVAAPVRLKPEHEPLYHLVFATRSPYGLWVFADALAKAQQEWRAAQYEEEPEDPADAGVLFGAAELLAELEERTHRQGMEALRANLLSLLERHAKVRLLDQVREVFGDWYGVARETWVREAIKSLHREGLTPSTGVGPRIRELTIERTS